MAKKLQGDVITVGGKQSQFIGVQLGEFVLRPDSDSGTRPSALRAQDQKTTLVVEGGEIPWFVYWIFFVEFFFFNTFAINMFLQYKGVGAWKDYLYGEKWYQKLSLFSKTALAWLVFAGLMAPN